MSLRGTVIRWKWFVKEVVVLFPVILLTSSACTMVPAPRGQSPSEIPGDSQVFRYNHPLFILELKNVEVFDNEIRLTFMYTNRTNGQQRGGHVMDRAYLVDNLGNRYPYASNSDPDLAHWPPQIPVEFWATFTKATPIGSSVSLILPWNVISPSYDVQRVDITFRRILLPSEPSAAQGFRYSHRLFTLELKNVEVVNDEVRINLTYTNRSDSPQYAGLGMGDAYLIDNLGKRYTYKSDSFSGAQGGFPPQAAEEIWITFAKLQPGSSSVNLILPWRTRGAAPVSVTFRGIPLP